MTSEAAINNSFVIEHADGPIDCFVAIAAGGGRPNVIEGLALGLLIVVAAFAGFAGLGVIEAGNAPGGDAVAVFALVCRLDVQRLLAGCDLAIVAGEAVAADAAMIDMHRCPVQLGVAVATGIRGLGMVLGFALGHVAVVAAEAGCRNALEDRTCMTGFTRNVDMRTFQ